MKGKDDKPMHIAFGTKVPVPQSNQTRKAISAPSREVSCSEGRLSLYYSEFDGVLD